MSEDIPYPPPWKVARFIDSASGEPVFEVTTDRGDPREEYDVFSNLDEATAAYIVKAGNAYRKLVTAVQYLAPTCANTDTRSWAENLLRELGEKV